MILYSAATGNGRRAAIALEECGVRYELRKVELGKGSRKPPELLAINPDGTIPTLLDPHGPGGGPLALRQSSAILLYLAEKHGALLPSAAERPAMLEWLMFAITDVVGANTAMHYASTEFPQGEAGAYFRAQLVSYLRVCDGRLGQVEWLSGRTYTVADVALFPVLVSRRALVDETPGLENLKRWGAAVSRRAAVQRALELLG